jgi:hypothetical protein
MLRESRKTHAHSQEIVGDIIRGERSDGRPGIPVKGSGLPVLRCNMLRGQGLWNCKSKNLVRSTNNSARCSLTWLRHVKVMLILLNLSPLPSVIFILVFDQLIFRILCAKKRSGHGEHKGSCRDSRPTTPNRFSYPNRAPALLPFLSVSCGDLPDAGGCRVSPSRCCANRRESCEYLYGPHEHNISDQSKSDSAPS